MRAFIPALIAFVLLVGFFMAAPNAPAVSAYPTALRNFDAPTAWSDGCVWQQVCVDGHWCVQGTDPCEGCEYNGIERCTGCII